MKTIQYTKFANQRKREYEILTSIIEDAGEKYVEKQALYNDGIEHITSLLKKRELLYTIFKDSKWEFVSCELCGTGKAKFPFVNGQSFSSLVEQAYIKEDYNKIVSYISEVSNLFFKNPNLHEFKNNEDCKRVFKNVNIPSGLHAMEISNIDMILDNIIKIGEKNIVIDYEWVFEFPIPVEFILFRSLYLCPVISKLSDELKEEIYQICRIKKEYVDLFEQMEFDFQDYVSGGNNNLAAIYKKINPINMRLDYIDVDSIINRYTIYLNDNMVCSQNTMENDIYINIYNVKEGDCIKWQLNTSNGIYKISNVYGKNVNGETEEILISKSNSGLCIEDDYYFIDSNPYIETVCHNSFEIVTIHYNILLKRMPLMETLVKALKNNNKLELELEQSNNDLIEYKRAYEEYKKAYEISSEEIKKLQSTLLWKIGVRLKHFRGNK